MKGTIIASTPSGFIVKFNDNLFMEVYSYQLPLNSMKGDRIDIPLNYLDSNSIIDFL